MGQRLGENGQVPNRSERYFKQESYWYYSTREGVNIGPFDHQSDAHEGCMEFIEFVSVVDPAFLQH